MKNYLALLALSTLVLAGCKPDTAVQISGGCPQFPPKQISKSDGPMASTSFSGMLRHAAPTHHIPIPQGPIGDVRIILDRSGCFGSCPSYRVELRGNGEVHFQGGSYVMIAGDHTARVPQSTIRCLLEDFRYADFWSLDDAYQASVTDNPTRKITLIIGGKSKSVTDYVGEEVGMPATVTALEHAIDKAALTETWIKGNEKTIPALDAEHFDFRSRAAANLLAAAAQSAPDAVVNAMLDRGAPIDGKISDPFDTDAFSTVEVAAREGKLTLLKRLIDLGAFRRGGQALVSATLRASVASQRADVVAEVLKYHPEINSTDKHGDTALALIFTGGHPHAGDDGAVDEDVAIIRLLGKAGANPNLPTSEHDDLLSHAYSPEDVRALIKIGARRSK